MFFFERATWQSRVNEARSAERKNKGPSRLPSEPEKRLIFSPTIRQRASGTRVNELLFLSKTCFACFVCCKAISCGAVNVMFRINENNEMAYCAVPCYSKCPDCHKNSIRINASPYARLLKLYFLVVFLTTIKHIFLHLAETHVGTRNDLNKFKFRALTHNSQ